MEILSSTLFIRLTGLIQFQSDCRWASQMQLKHQPKSQVARRTKNLEEKKKWNQQ